MRAFHATTHREIVGNLEVAETFRARSKGLLGKTAMVAGEGLLIKPCKGVHTFGMKFPIDVIVLDKKNRIIDLFKDLLPNRLTPIYLRAASVIELPAGTVEASGVATGDDIVLV